ncbi:nucleolar protein 14 isoform X2 [Panulirus ornatus]|uniref:nucleolar protein 14 isoform X2 n=1 Tax=Panulirus ornatus TaxID=150431 RepID=UPI003A88FADB
MDCLSCRTKHQSYRIVNMNKNSVKPQSVRNRKGFERGKEKRHNPFELHINRVKHDVLGCKRKQDFGLPGVARAKAVKKRERSLLLEYKLRNKSNVFVDRRIGENDTNMDPDRKIALRLAAEKKRQFNKKELFNLNDEDELTHKGLSLDDYNMNDKLDISDDDEDDMLDAQFVKEQHFGGGGFLTKREELGADGKDESKPKSRKDWIDNIIAEYKKKKFEFKKKKEEHYEAVSKLDAELQSFMQIMATNTMTDDDKDKAQKNCEFRDYDILMRQLIFDRSGKAMAVEKLKTPEMLAKEEQERLLKLEEDRVRRMKGKEDKGKVGLKSADDLDDGFMVEKESRFHVSYKDGEIIAKPEDEETDVDDQDQDEIPRDSKEEEEGEDEQNKSKDEKDDDDDDDDDDDESDKYSDILEESTSEEDEELPEEKVQVLKINHKKRDMMEAAKAEIPYTFEVPQDYESFWVLLEDHSPQEVSLILERMISCNHPSLGANNKEKCDDIFVYLMQTLQVLTDSEDDSPISGVSPMLYVDYIVLHIFTITQLSPVNSAKAFSQVLEEKYEDCAKAKFRRYPMASTFAFLKIAGILFPASDYVHPIMTPVITFLIQLLGCAKIMSRRDITAALFSAHLLFEYISLSKRFVPELTNLLNGLLFIAIQENNKTHLPFTPPFKPVGAPAYLLVLENAVTEYAERNLTLVGINNKEEELTDDFKTDVLYKSVKLLHHVCKCWSELPSVHSIMAPTMKLLHFLSLNNYPECVNKAVEELLSAIKSLPTQGSALVKEEGKPASIKMFEPAVENVMEGTKKHHGTKAYLEKQKLIHKLKRERKGARREILRDNAFLARQQLMETLKSDAERKRKIGQIMSGLQTQEGEFKKMKNKK